MWITFPLFLRSVKTEGGLNSATGRTNKRKASGLTENGFKLKWLLDKEEVGSLNFTFWPIKARGCKWNNRLNR